MPKPAVQTHLPSDSHYYLRLALPAAFGFLLVWVTRFTGLTNAPLDVTLGWSLIVAGILGFTIGPVWQGTADLPHTPDPLHKKPRRRK
jgi:hypothetical protein